MTRSSTTTSGKNFGTLNIQCDETLSKAWVPYKRAVSSLNRLFIHLFGLFSEVVRVRVLSTLVYK